MREQNRSHGAARHAAREADARQAGGEDPAGHALRGQVGRVPLHRVPRRRRGRAGQPHRQDADQVLPRTGRGVAGAGAAPVRARRGDRDRPRRAAGLRRADRADPPGRLPGADARREDPGLVRRLRSAGAGRPGAARRAAHRPPGPAGGGPRRSRRAGAPGARDHGPGGGRAVVRAVRGGRSRRDRGQAARPALPAGRTGHVQDQARADGGRRGGRVPPAQERPGGGLAAAGPVRRRGPAPACGRVGRLPHEAARRTGRGAGAAADGRRRRASVGGLVRGGRPRDRPAAGGAEPLVREEGPVLGAVAPGAGGGGRLRPHGERAAFPAHRPFPPLATRPHPRRLHLRPVGGAGAVRPRGDPRREGMSHGFMRTLTAPSCLRWNIS
ncbi:DNA_ligase_IV_Ku-like [Streptomyces misionensis JCM 4497]